MAVKLHIKIIEINDMHTKRHNLFFFFFNVPAPPEISPLSLPGALPILPSYLVTPPRGGGGVVALFLLHGAPGGRPAFSSSCLRPPLSLVELDDSDSRVCVHVR